MPELPEVEVLVRHLAPLLAGRRVRDVAVHRAKVIAPDTPAKFQRALREATFETVQRRGKYLVFELRRAGSRERFRVLGHLGMTGRMYLQAHHAPLPKHTAVSLGFDDHRFVFEDTRYFGRMSLELSALSALGPEPLAATFTVDAFAASLSRSAQPIKVKLLDQAIVAGVGNIYASEALFRTGISPRRAARRLKREQVAQLREAIREVLAEAIRFGSTVPLDWPGAGAGDGLFYYGRAAGEPDFYEERLAVYDRAGQACGVCGTRIRRIVQAGRSTYFCPRCQRG